MLIGKRKFGDLLNCGTDTVDDQDYIIRMIAKRGRVVSKKKELFCEIIDICYDSDDTARIFRMTLADASFLELQRPEFTSTKISEGLIGSWKLCANGFLKFIEHYDGPCSTEDITNYLLDDASHFIVRERYEAVFGKE